MKCPECKEKMVKAEAVFETQPKNTELWDCPNCGYQEIVELKTFQTKSQWKSRK